MAIYPANEEIVVLRVWFLVLCVLISRVISAGTFVYFAAEEPPSSKDQVHESKYCYRFTADSLEAQKTKLLKKYGDELREIKLEATEGGKHVFTAYRMGNDGRRINYFYSDDPAVCDNYQKSRLLPPDRDKNDAAGSGRAQPVAATGDLQKQRHCGPTVEDAVKSYFLPIQGKNYRYDMLDDDGDGRVTRSRRYTESGNIDGEFSAVFREVVLLGSLKTRTIEVYAINCNEVYLSTTENNLTGKQVHVIRPVILVLPIAGRNAHWTWSNEDGKHENTATFVDNVTTPLKRFNDVLLVSEELIYQGVLIQAKWYYAKGYGLVKEEHFVDRQRNPFVSDHVVKIE